MQTKSYTLIASLRLQNYQQAIQFYLFSHSVRNIQKNLIHTVFCTVISFSASVRAPLCISSYLRSCSQCIHQFIEVLLGYSSDIPIFPRSSANKTEPEINSPICYSVFEPQKALCRHHWLFMTLLWTLAASQSTRIRIFLPSRACQNFDKVLLRILIIIWILWVEAD